MAGFLAVKIWGGGGDGVVVVVNLLLFSYIYLFVYYCCNCVSETINFLVYHPPPSSHEMITSIFGCVMCLLLLSVSDI